MSSSKDNYSYQDDELQKKAKVIAKTLYRYDRLAENRITSFDDLTEEHVKQFWDQGYLVIDHAINAQEVHQSIEALMDIMHGRVEGPKIQFVKSPSELKTEEERELAVRKISHYIDYDSRLHEIANHKDVLAAFKKLFKEKAKVVQDQAILKPPSGGTEKPWHQDMAYGNLTYGKSVIGIWIALDPAELDNGCMHVIPGSHMEGAVPHYAVRDWQLCDRNVRVEQDLAIPLEPGGALLFSGLLHHGTPPNFSKKRRRALQIHYAPESAEKMTPQAYKLMFTNEMTGAEC